MSTKSDTTHKVSLQSDDKMKRHFNKSFCLGSLVGIVLFCVGFVGGKLIVIYVYHGRPEAEVTCKNIPEWPGKADVTTQSQYTASNMMTPQATTRNRTFTYTINNQLEKPFFEETMEMNIINKKPLVYYMEQSVLTNTKRFSSFNAIFEVYEPVFYGYFIKAVNGREGFWSVNKTNWRITNSSREIGLSVSNYIPRPNDVILFNFTIGDPSK